ncbi:MAG TPA: HAD-IB family hydrolase [Candidatus Paceibacterota bacterium]|nr:HAD-IB family hydrolase [Candidatus Paceibacterota bacterium]
MEKRPVAVFDIDGTIFRSSLLIELVERLIQKGIFPPTARDIYEEDRLQWLDRKGDYQAYIQKVVTAFEGQIKGISYEEVANLAGEVIEEKRSRVYRYTRDLIKDLKKKGYFLLAISHSPKFIVDGFGYEMGFDKTYGVFYASGASDKFTGEIEDRDLIFNKAAVLQRAVRKENLTLDDSVIVGDTESDIPMLEMATTPIAFNPNSKLYQHAKRRGWKVIVERKDVIYEL